MTRAVLAATGLAAAAVMARRYPAMRKALAEVPAELRSPWLAIAFLPYTARTLPLHRMAYRFSSKPGNGVTVTERHVAGAPPVRVLVTTSSSQVVRRPAVLHIHGGGMVVGSPQGEAPRAGRLARELGAVVVSPAYRLAPENPFPAALDDCMATLRWMVARADELGIDPDRIAVTGASAGGGIAAALAQRSFDERIPLRAQVLLYPMLDDRTALRDDHRGRGGLFWTPPSNRFGWTAYLGREPRMSDAPQYAAPGRRADLTGLPPAWIGVGDLDLLFEEDVAYAERLRACGVPCELVTIPRMYHGADAIAPKAASMRRFREGALRHLRSYL